MNHMFYGAEAYNNGDAALDWGLKTGLVEDMGYMFRYAKGFNQDLSGWDVSGVKDMRGMFEGAEEYNNGLASGVGGTLDWGDDTGLVEYMGYMFYNAKAFNQEISGWDVSGVKNMHYMFYGAEAYTNKGAKLAWSLSAEVKAKNDQYSISAGYDVSSMYNMFGGVSPLGSDVSKHPDGCKCDISTHKL